jgi:peptidoglycan hydrolase-like protein with peptidoglycan-binding domain
MSRTLCGPGSRGDLAGTLQKALVTAGVPLPKVDEIYGNDTEKAVREFQRQTNIVQTGVVDDTTWTVLTRLPVPTLFERSLQLTAAFEGHNYTLAVGDFDGAGLTWGIIGFTLSNGEVQGLLVDLDAADRRFIDSAFGPAAAELRQMLRSPLAQQMAWAQRNTVDGRGLAEPWKAGFAALGNLTAVREEQRRRARQNYFQPALQTAARASLTSELGIALAFDIHVQNGGIKDVAAAAIARQLATIPNASERARREIIANAVADASKPEFREDVRLRKLSIARGAGTVHGRAYRLENWGLADVRAVSA